MAPRTVKEKQDVIRENLTREVLCNLYAAERYLNADTRDRVGLTIFCPIFIQDPLVARTQEATLPWEPGITDGPTSSRIAVVDYNADAQTLTAPAVWDDKKRAFLTPGKQPIDVGNASDPHFRQVNAWAIVQRTLEFYQSPQIMGRPIPWGCDGNRLIVVPAAGAGENAFYDRDSKSLQFYYFGESDKLGFTCLSHDIVSHETGHALLDGIRPYYYQHSSVQTTAFHEFVGDLTAIFTALRHNDLRDLLVKLANSKDEAVLVKTIGNLAEQFGSYVSGRPYLRSASEKRTLADVADNPEPHDVSEVLTSAVFRILQRLAQFYLKRPDADGTYPSAKESLWRAFQRVSATAFQALDFCPPVDIQFLDYVRAFLRCDELSDPVDEKGLRKIMKDVFHEWGFCGRKKCDGGALCDLCFDTKELANLRSRSIFRSIDRISRSRTEAYHYVNDNRKALEIPAFQDLRITDLYEANKFDPAANRLPPQIIMEYVWEEEVKLEGSQYGEYDGKVAELLCGGTIVFDDRGNLLYVCRKSGTETEEGRLRRDNLLADYAEQISTGMVARADDLPGVVLADSRPLVATTFGNIVRLTSTPHMRNGRHSAESEAWTASF